MAIDISVVIPTYREDPKTLEQNIDYMKEQTAYQKGKMEIIISDFYEYYPKPEEERFKWAKGQKNIRIVHADRRGIAYGRHTGIMASKGKAIVNFDADGYLAPIEAVDLLTEPILEKRAHLTCCDNILDIRDLTPEQAQSINFIVNMLETFNNMQRTPLTAILEAGMSFSREAYNFVQGFSDVRQYEGFIIGAKIIHAYTFAYKLHIPQVKAILSPRRALASVKYGLLNSYADYLNQNFR
jgi:glycosyltransferase involved in cell wall biosynthesis